MPEVKYPGLGPDEIIDFIPHRPPFRFIDKVLEVSEDGALGQYTFREDEWFYKGHFPDYPITPGVILTEAMIHMGHLPLTVFLISQRINDPEELKQYGALLTETDMEFCKPVFPGETVTTKSRKVFNRLGKLRSKLELRNSKGELCAVGEIAGVGGLRESRA